MTQQGKQDLDKQDLDKEDLENGRMLRALKGTLTEQAVRASYALITLAVSVNSTLTDITHHGVTLSGQPVGDWKITAERLPSQAKDPVKKQRERFVFTPARNAG